RKQGQFIPLRVLIANDDWLRKSQHLGTAVLGYAQSLALFRMLMEEKPADLKKYLATIYNRRSPESRLLDFAECFGKDLDKFERHYVSYLQKAAATQARPPSR